LAAILAAHHIVVTMKKKIFTDINKYKATTSQGLVVQKVLLKLLQIYTPILLTTSDSEFDFSCIYDEVFYVGQIKNLSPLIFFF